MAENTEAPAPAAATPPESSFMEKIAEKLNFHETKEENHHKEPEKAKEKEKEKEKEDFSSSSSSSSSSDDEDSEKKVKAVSSPSSTKAKISRIFGREKPPVHQVLGGGKPADVFLWRNKKISAGVLGTATAIWILFELLESPPHFPELSLPEQPFLQVAAALRFELNRGFALVHDIAVGKDLKKFLAVIAGLWLLSIVGKSCDFLTLVYINFVLLHTVPVLYEKHEEKVDACAEKALSEAKKHYGVVNERYISKIPLGPLKTKKAD